ncbi:Hydrogen peroxide-inducible genes activator [Baekduia alba]|uniref:LysR family transcriptional regulator n=1 Tax=Baekduia alba TaxID=2997333 RepID=UPI0023412D51|nr:LysR family transcriptional regulator [Baekduia alba]WCB96329.1 Hydrogen peroxide-inducible genes activator [Baekduia alba]
MELRALSYFVAVAEAGSFTRAAEQLHIVQPAVSQQVRRLEDELGVALFTRTTRAVTLTAAGERLLSEARAVLAAADRTRRVAAELASGDAAELRLATASGLGPWLHRVLDALAGSAPGVSVRLTTLPYRERVAAVAAGTLDAALVHAARAVADGLELIPVTTTPLVAALPANHALAGRDRLALADLAALPVRLAPRDRNAAFHDFITSALAGAGPAPVHASPFSTLQNTLAEISAGPASWAPIYGHIPSLPDVPGVAFLPIDGPEVVTSLVVADGPPGPAIRALLDACAAAGAAAPER